MTNRFLNLYHHDFARVAVGVPQCRVADPAYNAQQTIALAREADNAGAALIAFPELGLSAYTCDDLFHQRAMLDACEMALADVVAASITLSTVMIIGMPVRVDQRLFNCAIVVSGGRIHGVVPKSYLPNYNEFYEARQFNAADCSSAEAISLLSQTVPFGAALIFEFSDMPLLRFHLEICEDVWVPIPPSSFAALAGATVLVNLSASNVLLGKEVYRRELVRQQSTRCLAAYLYSSAGQGESTSDLAWDGQALIYENGECLSKSERFLEASHLIFADLDLERLAYERMHKTTFGQSVRRHKDEVEKFRVIHIDLKLPRDIILPLERTVERFPYVPADSKRRDEHCREVYNIQVQALTQRLLSSHIKKVLIGISGGLDSTHALLVCAKVMDRLGLPRTNILAYTMPGFGTTERTLKQARRLMTLIGCNTQEIDIRPSCLQMLKDLGHPYADGQEVFDVTFENVQAGERTSRLFRLANYQQAIVVGTGDLSELALGWCTYGVGDQMAHYNLNASVPKTLIKYLINWVADATDMGDSTFSFVRKEEDTTALSNVLTDILGSNISPELVPGKEDVGTEQKTEDFIGPYDLQDFHLYYTLRFGFTPSKIAFLAYSAWKDEDVGRWPDVVGTRRHQYDLPEIKRNLRIFLDRFFRTSQFKRSCMPNAPKVGMGSSLSPRGDWRAPSDGESALWLAQLDKIPDDPNA
ncbi:NAD(+) synthase [Candidatus Pandoraea novymonadis]|uniref:Glutamine-dependent NAD(+) synthetase n=1 Tax=Candidatus Pandoraea novymonadis TaxID=1808959 RepID=A0ABX5FE55_9BURK|nr:NAD(+) synthase [Candidatus Pandoraea novymonadis]PSB92000.1 Glutamine-dependent NAD(+) synthetase [Candidatus Pandoraea novymonadis]